MCSNEEVELLIKNPQCNDLRIDKAWNEYQEYAFDHEPLRYLRQCGRCDSFALSLRWANEAQSDVALICLDCKYTIVWPITRAYWMWKTFVHPQDPMLDWKIEDGEIKYFTKRRGRSECFQD